jgi:hypothetical protein
MLLQKQLTTRRGVNTYNRLPPPVLILSEFDRPKPAISSEAPSFPLSLCGVLPRYSQLDRRFTIARYGFDRCGPQNRQWAQWNGSRDSRDTQESRRVGVIGYQSAKGARVSDGEPRVWCRASTSTGHWNRVPARLTIPSTSNAKKLKFIVSRVHPILV